MVANAANCGVAPMTAATVLGSRQDLAHGWLEQAASFADAVG